MASYKELNEELEQMKAEFLTLHSEEEEREFGEKMERFVASKSPEDRKILAQAFVNGAKESCERAEKLYVFIWKGYMNQFRGLMLLDTILERVDHGCASV